MGSELRKLKSIATVLLSVAVVAPTAAFAQTSGRPSAEVKVLVRNMEAALLSLGCDASKQDYVDSLQAAIATSGDDPSVVQSALRVLSDTPLSCPGYKPAIYQVDAIVAQAQQETFYPTSNGPGPGIPIGPTGLFAGGGADYRP